MVTIKPNQLTDLFPHAELITWVRDPVERVISSYHHRLRDPDPQHPVCHELHDRKLSLTQYASLPLVRNEMTRYFGSKNQRISSSSASWSSSNSRCVDGAGTRYPGSTGEKRQRQSGETGRLVSN